MKNLLLPILISMSCFFHPATAMDAPKVYAVSFTADWCPNCRVLDPVLDQAFADPDPAIERVVFDMTNDAEREKSFLRADGTILGNVYGDYLGVTGLAIFVAADSGETLSCATRLQTLSEIKTLVQASLVAAQDQPGARKVDLTNCPEANEKIAYEQVP